MLAHLFDLILNFLVIFFLFSARNCFQQLFGIITQIFGLSRRAELIVTFENVIWLRRH